MPRNPNDASIWARFISIMGDRWAVVRAAILVDSSLEETFTEENPGAVELMRGDTGTTPVQHINPLPVEIVYEGALADDDNPFPVEQIVQAEGVWVEMMNVRLDDAPTTFTSKPYHVDEESACRVYIFIDSTLAPTHVRIVAEHSYNYDGIMPPGNAVWAPMEEGFWASLGWEDTDTASGIWKNYQLPLAGEDWVRFRAVGTGTDANNYFDVRIIVRAFKGPHTAAHA